MINKIIGTTGTRILNAGITFLVLWIITNSLGKEGVGVISLIILDISIILLITDFIGGSALVYFASRANTKQLLVVSFSWVLIVVLCFYFGITLIKNMNISISAFIADEYLVHIAILSALNAFSLITFNLMIGFEKIRGYNIAFTIQVVTMATGLAIGIFVFKHRDIMAYIIALYISYFLSFVYGIASIIVHQKEKPGLVPKKIPNLVGQMLRYGSMGQFANLVTLTNKRFSFFIINRFIGTGQLGIYATSAQLTEGLRIIGQSISIVQFARIANTNDIGYAKMITIKLLKFTLFLTFIAIIVLISIPTSLFATVFGDDFAGVKPVVLALSVGILAMSATMIFAHFFSGTGKPKYNLYSSAAGLIATIGSTLLLIPVYGIIGAGFSISISYCIIVTYQFIVFKRLTKAKFKEFIPDKSDLRFLRREVMSKYFK